MNFFKLKHERCVLTSEKYVNSYLHNVCGTRGSAALVQRRKFFPAKGSIFFVTNNTKIFKEN